jgi:hypothetical protein
MSRSLRRHHRERLIRRVRGYNEWFESRAHRLYDTRKFCTCVICGNPRRILRGRRHWTPKERREWERIRYEIESELNRAASGEGREGGAAERRSPLRGV